MFKQLCVLAFVATAFVTDWSVEQAAASVSGKTYVAVFAPTTTQYEFQTSGVFIEPNFRGAWSEVQLGSNSLWRASGNYGYAGVQIGNLLLVFGLRIEMGFDGTIFYLKDLKTTFVVAIELPTGSTANSSPHVPPSLVSGLSRASN